MSRFRMMLCLADRVSWTASRRLNQTTRLPVLGRALLPLITLSALITGCHAKSSSSIDPPAEARQLLQVSGKGVQIYTCVVSPTAPDQGPQWTLKGPDAKLYDATGNVIGTHFAGPTWKLNDGSQVQGQLPVSRPAPDPASSVPWLLLRARPGTAQGRLAGVGFIQRTQTQGGVPDKSACQAPGDVGKTSQVPYSATYTFYAAQ